MTVGLVGPHKSQVRRPKVMLIDLDDTLYRAHTIPTIVRERIQEFMVKKLGISEDKVTALTLELYQKYGTTLAGLVASGYKIDYDEWHEFVHQGALDYNTLLHPDPSLRDILCSIDMPKYILTNANREHMELCLQRLGISDCFQGEYYFENVMDMAASHGFDTAHGVLCKPMPRIYTLIAEQLGISLSEVLFFDDSVRNLAAAHALGAFTVLVGAEAAPPGAAGIDLALPTMHALPAAMPQLLDQPGLVHDEPHVHVHAHAHGHVHTHGHGHAHAHGVQAEREREHRSAMAGAGTSAEASAILVPS